MSLVIASQFGEALDAVIRKHPLAPTVVAASADTPWEAAQAADAFFANPLPIWRRVREMPAPPGWPGRLRWILSGSSGVDAYPRWLLDAPLFTCGRGLATDEIADYVLSAIYHHSKDLASVTVNAPEQWRQMPLGRVAGSTFGLVGYGAIGKAVGRRALALGAKVAVFRRRSTESAPDDVVILDDLAELVASADHIIVAVPATPATFRLIDGSILSRAQRHAHLINVSRGSVIDHDALLLALDGSRLAFATLDVTDPEPLPPEHAFWHHPKVRLTPHLSSYHPRILDDILRFALTNLERFARGEQPANPVDPVQGY